MVNLEQSALIWPYIILVRIVFPADKHWKNNEDSVMYKFKSLSMRIRNGGHAGEGGADNRDLVDGDGSQNLSRNLFIQHRTPPPPLNIPVKPGQKHGNPDTG
jgi:hypothetical protein